MRALLHIPRSVLKGALYAVIAGAVLFLALTRTQVGRDGLRLQFERQFNLTFHGQLRIGQLQGNLLNTLYAHNVHLLDRDGALVASIDAAVVRLRWQDLLRRTVSLNSITLIQPELNLLLREDSTWNIGDLFKRRDPSVRNDPWEFTSADIRIMDGAVHTHNLGADPLPVREGRLFDYTRYDISRIQTRMNVEWVSDIKLLDIDYFSSDLPPIAKRIENVQGQFVIMDDKVELNQVGVLFGGTTLVMTGSLDHISQFPDMPGDAALDLELFDSRIAHADLQHFFPRLPVADTLQASARLRGTLRDLSVPAFNVRRGATALSGTGFLYGYPDSLSIAVNVDPGRLTGGDLKAIYPAGRFDPIETMGVVEIDRLDARGTFHPGASGARPFSVSLTLDAHSAAGHVAGSADLSMNAARRLSYRTDLQVDSLNLARALPEAPTSDINGALYAYGNDIAPEKLDGELHLALRSSSVEDRRVDTLDVYLAADAGVWNAFLLARPEGSGRLEAEGRVNFASAQPTVAGELTLRRLDLGELLRNDSLQTDLNARLRWRGEGLAWNDIRGRLQLAIDSSTVTHGDAEPRPILANQSTVTIEDLPTGARRLTLDGDALTLTAEGNMVALPLAALGRLWGESLARAVERERNKPRMIVLDPDEAEETLTERAFATTIDELYIEQLQRRAYQRIAEAGTDSILHVDVRLDLHRSDLLIGAFPPTFNELDTDLHGDLQLDIGPSQLGIAGTFFGDSLETGLTKSKSPHIEFQLTGSLDTPLMDNLQMQASLAADSLLFAGHYFRHPSMAFTLGRRNGRFTFLTQSGPRSGSQRLSARLDLLPDRNRLILQDLALSIGSSAWKTIASGPIDFYSDAIVLPDFVLESPGADDAETQRIRIDGVFSDRSVDTTFIHIEEIGIRPFSEFANMNLPMGGLVSGRLAFTSHDRQPELTGSVDIDHFSLDNRVLGNLNVASRYLPGLPDVGLTVDLAPVPDADQSALLPDAAVRSIYEENALQIAGTFRLPVYNRQRTGFLDPGALNLDVNLERADVFFFEFIFPELLRNVNGFVAGSGKISGDFSYPLFDADLQLADGALDMPRFDLSLRDVKSPVRVDRRGIHLANATLRDQMGGTAQIEGSFLFNEYRYFSFDLRGALDELLIMNRSTADDLPFYGQIWASGSLTLTGPAYNALLRSTDAVTRANSELYIPVTEEEEFSDVGFLIYADSTGEVPDFRRLAYRSNLLSKRPEGERRFIDGLSMDLNIFAPAGSTIHLVFDPLLGDVVNAVGSGRIQLQRREGEIATFGTLNIASGDYLFTAGEVFARRFLIDSGGTLTWDGDPIDAAIHIPASYKTRASPAGLPGEALSGTTFIPLVVKLDITGRVSTPEVALSLETDQSDRNYTGNYAGIEAILNQPERSTDFATSVLLTNSFLLTTENLTGAGSLTNSGEQLAFSSVSQLVASQLNRFLNEALPNVDFNLGLQGESIQDPGVTAGVALYLLDERLVIRGQGVYQNEQTQNQSGLEGEFTVEVRLNPSVSVEVFLRREGDVLAENALTSTRGAGLSYQTQFASWRRLWSRIFGKKRPDPTDDEVAQR
ncbi:MAG: translocation/assembly module TamB domain-containing protein [Rhodothermales bacterium]